MYKAGLTEQARAKWQKAMKMLGNLFDIETAEQARPNPKGSNGHLLPRVTKAGLLSDPLPALDSRFCNPTDGRMLASRSRLLQAAPEAGCCSTAPCNNVKLSSSLHCSLHILKCHTYNCEQRRCQLFFDTAYERAPKP